MIYRVHVFFFSVYISMLDMCHNVEPIICPWIFPILLIFYRHMHKWECRYVVVPSCPTFLLFIVSMYSFLVYISMHHSRHVSQCRTYIIRMDIPNIANIFARFSIQYFQYCWFLKLLRPDVTDIDSEILTLIASIYWMCLHVTGRWVFYEKLYKNTHTFRNFC